MVSEVEADIALSASCSLCANWLCIRSNSGFGGRGGACTFEVRGIVVFVMLDRSSSSNRSGGGIDGAGRVGGA